MRFLRPGRKYKTLAVRGGAHDYHGFYALFCYKWMNNLFKRLVWGLGIVLVLGLAAGALGYGLGDVLVGMLVLVLVYGSVTGLVCGLLDGFTVGEIGTQSFPNQGIRRSMRNALISWLGGGLGAMLVWQLVFGLLIELLSGSGIRLVWGLAFGMVLGPAFGLRFGGRAYLHHFALRLILWHNNFAPLRYVHFLNYAAARIFLRKVGGGYVFVHRMLLEHFAARYQTSAEQ
jgi:hypothetical protein